MVRSQWHTLPAFWSAWGRVLQILKESSMKGKISLFLSLCVVQFHAKAFTSQFVQHQALAIRVFFTFLPCVFHPEYPGVWILTQLSNPLMALQPGGGPAPFTRTAGSLSLDWSTCSVLLMCNLLVNLLACQQHVSIATDQLGGRFSCVWACNRSWSPPWGLCWQTSRWQGISALEADKLKKLLHHRPPSNPIQVKVKDWHWEPLPRLPVHITVTTD